MVHNERKKKKNDERSGFSSRPVIDRSAAAACVTPFYWELTWSFVIDPLPDFPRERSAGRPAQRLIGRTLT